MFCPYNKRQFNDIIGEDMTTKPIPTPNLLSEMFMSMLKTFLVIVVVLIFLIATILSIFVFKPNTPRMGDNHVQITQTGNHDIKQTINN